MRDRAQSAIAALESIATKPAAGNLIAKSTARSHGGSEPSPEASASSPSEDNYQSLPVRTLALFRGNPQRVFTVQEVSQAVHPENLHLIHGLLSRLVKERRIVRAGRAKYRAASGRTSTKEERRAIGHAAGISAPDNGKGAAQAGRAPRGTWMPAVLDACNAFNGDLTVNAVMNQMTASGFKWKIKFPRITVTKTLNRLVRDGKIELLELGTCGTESKYRKL